MQTKFSVEGCLLPVGCGDANYTVTSCQVQCGEQAGAVHRVE